MCIIIAYLFISIFIQGEPDMTKVFIDGSAGTTGLRIWERLAERKDLELLSIPERLRKDDAARREFLNRADVAFLCLPDGAAIEAAEMVENPDTVVIDTAAAHIAGLLQDKDDPSTLIPQLTVSRARELQGQGIISGGMIPKVECCIDAIQAGVKHVVMMDGRVPHSLLMELLTDEGAGTMVIEG